MKHIPLFSLFALLAPLIVHAAPLSQEDAMVVLESQEGAQRVLAVTGGIVRCSGNKSVGVWVIRAQREVRLHGFTVVGCQTGVVVEESSCPGIAQRNGEEPTVHISGMTYVQDETMVSTPFGTPFTVGAR